MALPQTLSLASGQQGRIDDLRLPNAIPTISVANNKIDALIGATYHYVTLQNGQVNSGSDPPTVIKNDLDKTTGSWSVTCDASQMLLQISCSENFTFTDCLAGNQ